MDANATSQDLHQPAPAAPPARWPELMRPDTLAEYLDCRSATDFARKLRILEERGYPGIDPVLNRHVKETVDRFIRGDAGGDEDARKKRMLDAINGGTQKT